MADTRLTKVGFLRALQLCAFGVFAPQKLLEAQVVDDEIRKGLPQPSSPPASGAFKVRRAFWTSLVLVLSSIAAGYTAGKGINVASGPVTSSLVGTLQIIGATMLLWGTLFVRGWDIQTYGGVTLTERVNQWIYRSLYCLGTAVVVTSLVLTPA
jgi:hypothetical protein